MKRNQLSKDIDPSKEGFKVSEGKLEKMYLKDRHIVKNPDLNLMSIINEAEEAQETIDLDLAIKKEEESDINSIPIHQKRANQTRPTILDKHRQFQELENMVYDSSYFRSGLSQDIVNHKSSTKSSILINPSSNHL